MPPLAGADEHDSFQTHWLVLPLRADLEDTAPEQGPIRIQLDADDEPIVVEADGGTVAAHIGKARNPNLTLHGSGRTITQLMLGRTTLAQARKRAARRHKPHCETSLKQAAA